jgi:hypothetical protein
MLSRSRALEAEGGTSRSSSLPLPQNLGDLVATRLRRLARTTRDLLLKVNALAQPTANG